MGGEYFGEGIEQLSYSLCELVDRRQEADHQPAVTGKPEQIPGLDVDAAAFQKV
jgi:hypothetical protein